VCILDGAMSIEITKNIVVGRVREKFRGEGARSRVELSVSDGRGIDRSENSPTILVSSGG